MNRRNLLTAALGLPLAPLAALASPHWIWSASVQSEVAISRMYFNGRLVWEAPVTTEHSQKGNQ